MPVGRCVAFIFLINFDIFPEKVSLFCFAFVFVLFCYFVLTCFEFGFILNLFICDFLSSSKNPATVGYSTLLRLNTNQGLNTPSPSSHKYKTKYTMNFQSKQINNYLLICNMRLAYIH